MKNAINTLRIQNFKSIKDVTMAPRRVNLIIGQPNVGKSNILEAMSLLGGMVYEQTDKFMGSFIRYEEPRQMFYDNLISNTIRIETDKDTAVVGKGSIDTRFKAFMVSNNTYGRIINQAKSISKGKYIFGDEDELIIDDFKSIIEAGKKGTGISVGDYIYTEFDGNALFGVDDVIATFNADSRYFIDVVTRPYIFSKLTSFDKEYKYNYLSPPHGNNLINIIQAFPSFRKEIAQMFEMYGLKLLLRVDERRLEIVKDLEGFIYSYPYSSIADTLQRIIFYLAAIESNDDAVILLEEPEAHSYPVYVSMLGRRMVESRNNQFFVATHSPYLITEILEQMLPDEGQAPELAIFVAYYEDYQTKVKQLSDEEVRAIRVDELDVFYNMSRFIPRPANG
jgi:AAA15 family ATPase/GTPase